MFDRQVAPPCQKEGQKDCFIGSPQQTRSAASGEALDNIGKFAVQAPEEAAEWVKFQRNKLYGIRRTIGSFYDRVKPCGHYPIKKGNDIPVVRGKNKSVYYTQLQQCKSVWACPICSMKINKRRTEEVRNMLTNAITDGFKVVVLVLTLPHYSNEKLHYLEKAVTESFRAITADVNYKGQYRSRGGESVLVKNGLKQKFGVEGFIKALEVKKSLANGWHPHLHVAFVLDPKTETHLQEFAEGVIKLWTDTLNERTGKKALRRCLSYTEVYDVAGISDYTTKWDIAKELVDSNSKDDGRGLPVFKLIELLQETGEAQYQDDFLTYIKAFKGKSPLTFSNGFKKKFLRGMEEKTDAEACSDGEIEEMLFSMSYDIFKQIQRAKKEAHLLNLVQYHPERVRGFLKEQVPDAINVARPEEPPRFVKV